MKDFHKFADRAPLANVEHEVHNLNMFGVKGEQWRKIRSLVSPTFTSGKMKKMQSMVTESTQHLLDNLSTKITGGQTELDVKKLFGGLTMEVIANCAFATKINSSEEAEHPFVKNANTMLDVKLKNVMPAILLPKCVNNFLGIHTIFDKTAHNYMLNLCRHIINERRNSKNKNQPNDLLQLMINAEHTGQDYRDKDDKLDAHHLNEGNTIDMIGFY